MSGLRVETISDYQMGSGLASRFGILRWYILARRTRDFSVSLGGRTLEASRNLGLELSPLSDPGSVGRPHRANSRGGAPGGLESRPDHYPHFHCSATEFFIVSVMVIMIQSWLA